MDGVSSGHTIALDEPHEKDSKEVLRPFENELSKSSSSERMPATESILAEVEEREESVSAIRGQTSLVCLDSNGEERQDEEQGSIREMTGLRSLEEKSTRPGFCNARRFETPEGGGRFVDGEEELPPPPSTTVYGISMVGSGGVGATASSSSGGNIPGIARTQSAPVEDISEACRGQKGRNNLQELAERVSEPLGMAIATVLHEIFEQNGICDSGSSPVNELSQLLGAALKESLFCVLGNERTIFVENFRSSFKRTFSTIRSVKRAYVETGGKLTRSRHPHPRSLRGSLSDPRRASLNQAHRELARKHMQRTSYTETRKHLKFADEGMTKSKAAGTRSNYPAQLIFAEIPSCSSPTRCRQQSEFNDAPSSSEKSCLNESLQSFYYTDSNCEQDAHSDTAGSCSKSCLSESLESSFASSIVEQGGQNGIARSSSMSSFVESLQSPLSQPTPDARDIKSEHLDTDESGENDIFSAMSSGESNNLMMVDRGDVISEARHKNQSNCTPTSLHPGLLPTPAANASDRAIVKPLDDPDDRLLQTRSPQVTFSANHDIRESSCATAEPSMNIHEAPRQESDLFGRGNGGNIIVHRRPRQVWGEVSQLSGSSLEDAVLRGTPPFLDYGVVGGRESLLQRYVEAKETQNHLRSLKLSQSMKRLSIEKDHLQLKSESNILMKENVVLSRSKAEFREFELEDRKLTAAHHELSQMCADELVAGLGVMLLALVYSAWKFSYTRLSRVVTMCHLPVKQPRPTGWFGTNWMSNSVDALAWHLKGLTCEVTKAGRMLAGLILIAFVASSLLRRHAMTSSQAMPATIILVVLAGVCGFAGKISIDSLGGNGFLWLQLWELLCFLHAFAACCTPWLYKYLYGPSSKFYQGRTSFWLRVCSICARFFFHAFLGFALPVMAGLLPFASLKELHKAFWELWETDTVIGPL